MKRVRVCIEMDEHFIRLLQANVELSDYGRKDKLDPSGVLALLISLEGRGALTEQVHLATPIEWREHIEVLCERREVLS